jgi:hypothetical protein
VTEGGGGEREEGSEKRAYHFLRSAARDSAHSIAIDNVVADQRVSIAGVSFVAIIRHDHLFDSGRHRLHTDPVLGKTRHGAIHDSAARGRARRTCEDSEAVAPDRPRSCKRIQVKRHVVSGDEDPRGVGSESCRPPADRTGNPLPTFRRVLPRPAGERLAELRYSTHSFLLPRDWHRLAWSSAQGLTRNAGFSDPGHQSG